MNLFPAQSAEQSALLGRFAKSLIWIGVVFSFPLFQIALFAYRSEFHSHVLLVPFVSVYLIRLCLTDGAWRPVATAAGAAWNPWTAVWAGLSILAAAGYLLSWTMDRPLKGDDALALGALAIVFAVYAAACGRFARASVAEITFPLAFLLFFVPFPTFVMDGIEVALQHASAEVASWFFQLTNLPFLREGLTFGLPGITIKVAQECSGVRSSLVLFMTSLIASYLFLKQSPHRWILTVFTLILGVVRNAFRILVIAWLCVEMGPEMIHSAIHKRGGPLFFGLSLIPLGGLLWLLIRRERGGPPGPAARAQERPSPPGELDPAGKRPGVSTKQA